MKKRLFCIFALTILLGICKGQSPKELQVPFTEKIPESAAQIPELMDQMQIPFEEINQLNWPDFAYRPERAALRIAYSKTGFLLHFRVKEQAIRALATKDNQAVFQDACVEFFVAPFDDSVYYNFEFNCIGTLLLEGGKPGARKPASSSVLKKVSRWSSLGRQPFDTRRENTYWELALMIPYEAFFCHSSDQFGKISSLDRLRANFYKCGDKLPKPHYLSWSPIVSPRPNFHLPEYFGTLLLR